MNDRCAEHLTNLIRLIERGEDVPEDLRAHVATCAECARVLDAMTRLQSDVPAEDDGTVEEPPVIAETVEKGAAAVERSSRKREIARALAAAAIIAAAGFLLAFGIDNPGRLRAAIGVVFLAIAPLVVVITLLVVLRRRLHEPGKAVYRRLGPGRQLAGVCLGLAEATGVAVLVVRVIFLALFFADGAGLWIYLLLMILMPVHPDDRQYLWRFQIARAIRSVRGRA